MCFHIVGEAVTLYTEDDAGQLRAIANVMRAAGCGVPPWMLALHKDRNRNEKRKPSATAHISPVNKFDRQALQHKRQMIHQSKQQKAS